MSEAELEEEVNVSEDPSTATADAKQIETKKATSSITRAIPKAAGLSGKKILIVEDSEAIRRLLKKTLEISGCIVDEAPDGKIGLEIMRKAIQRGHPHQIITTDIMMPVMNGVEMIKHMRSSEELRNLPVVVITSKGDRRVIMEVAKFNIASFVLKPFTTQKVIEGIEKALSCPVEPPKAHAPQPSAPNPNTDKMDELRALARQAAIESEKTHNLPVKENHVLQAVLSFLDRNFSQDNS